MTPNLALHHKLSEAARRIRLLLIIQWAGRTLLASAGISLLWLVASKVGWTETPAPVTVTILFGVGLCIGIAAGLAHKVTRMDVARLTDVRTESRERLASAVEFETAPNSDPLIARQLGDANARAHDLDLRRAYPLRVTRELALALFLSAVIFLAYFLPTMPLFWPKAMKEEIAQVKKQAAEMQKVVRISEKTADQKKLDDSKKAAREADKMLEAMKKSNTTKKAAMIQLAKMTKQIENQQKQMAAATAPAPKSLQKASEEIKKALEQRQQAVEQTEKAKKAAARAGSKQGEKPGEKSQDAAKPAEKQAKPGESKQESKAMEQAQQALQKFAQALSDQNSSQQNEALRQLADQLEKGQLSPEEMQSLQQQLQQMSQALKGTDLQKVSEQLKQMAELMKQLKLDPETLKKLAAMMRQAGGT